MDVEPTDVSPITLILKVLLFQSLGDVLESLGVQLDKGQSFHFKAFLGGPKKQNFINSNILKADMLLDYNLSITISIYYTAYIITQFIYRRRCYSLER